MRPGFSKVYGFLVLILASIMTTYCQEDVLPQGPVLIEPEDEAEFTSTPPVFVWESESGVDSYLLRIAQDSITSPIVILNYNTTDTTYELSPDAFDQLPSEQYAWAVASLYSGDTAWSTSRTFTIAGHGAGDILISPRDGESFTISPPEFVWKTFDTQKGYILRVAKDNFLTGLILIEDSLTDTTYSTSDSIFNSAPNGNYIWSVAPIPDTGKLFWWEFRNFIIDKPLPDGPDLISPTEGETITETPPTFIWHAEPLAEYYRIKIYGEDLHVPDTVISDTTSDTTFSITEEEFLIWFNGKYAWKVAAIASGGEEIWCEPQGFHIDKYVPSIDLDTTYFPFGLDYSWVYEKRQLDIMGDPWSFDTIAISVIDSTALTNGWSFSLEGSFLDVGRSISIINHIVTVFGNRKIYINPDNIDTLNIRYCYHKSYPYGYYEVTDINVQRIKGLGVVHQNDLWYNGDEIGPFEWEEYDYRLLYFIKGADTVWTSD